MRFIYMWLVMLFMVSCVTPGNITTGDINYKIYQGTWYEIARLPNKFEEGLNCITMTYEYQDSGVMTVINRGHSKNDPSDVKTLSGRAWIPDEKEPRKLKVQFILLVIRDYVLVHVDEEKGQAILGSPSKKQMWILSRTPVLPDEDFARLCKIAEKNEYKIDTLIRVEQVCK